MRKSNFLRLAIFEIRIFIQTSSFVLAQLLYKNCDAEIENTSFHALDYSFSRSE